MAAGGGKRASGQVSSNRSSLRPAIQPSAWPEAPQAARLIRQALCHLPGIHRRTQSPCPELLPSIRKECSTTDPHEGLGSSRGRNRPGTEGRGWATKEEMTVGCVCRDGAVSHAATARGTRGLQGLQALRMQKARVGGTQSRVGAGEGAACGPGRC